MIVVHKSSKEYVLLLLNLHHHAFSTVFKPLHRYLPSFGHHCSILGSRRTQVTHILRLNTRMNSDHNNLLEQGIEAIKKVFSSSSSSTDENAITHNSSTNSTVSNRKMAKNVDETSDDHKKAEPRYNGLLISGLRVAELRAALDKLGVGSKRTDKKADLEASLIAALEHHITITSPVGKRSRSVPGPLSALKSGGGVRSLSSPPAANLRNAGYQLRSRGGSSTRGTTSRSHTAESTAGHIKATIATSNKGSYEENDMVYYSVKGGAGKGLSRSPSVASRKSRARSVRSSRSSRANTHISEEGEENSTVESSDEEEEENAPPTVRKQRVTAPAASVKSKSPTPRKREPTPSKKGPTPKKRGPTPIKKESTQKKREPTPRKKDATPNKKQRVEPAGAEEGEGDESESGQLESVSGEGSDHEDVNDEKDENEEEQEEEDDDAHAALNDSNNFFDADDGAGEEEEGEEDDNEDEGEAAEMFEEGLETLEQNEQDQDREQYQQDGEEGEGSGGGVVEMLQGGDEEYSDDSAEEGEGEGNDEDSQDADMEVEGEGEEEEEEEGGEEGEYGDEDDDEYDSEVDSEEEEEDSEDEAEGEGKCKPGEVIDLMESSEDEDAGAEDDYEPPSFPSFTFSAPTTVAGATLTDASTAAGDSTFPKFTFSVGSSSATKDKPAVSYGFNGKPVAAPAVPSNNPFAISNFIFSAPAATATPAAAAPVLPAAFTFQPPPVQVTGVTQPAAPVAAGAAAASAEMSPAALAFSKLSNNFVSVITHNLTSSKKEKLSAEEYALLKALLESSKPAEIADEEEKEAKRKSNMEVEQVQSPHREAAHSVRFADAPGAATLDSAKKVTSPAALNTEQLSKTAVKMDVQKEAHLQENKENKTAKSISFDPHSTAIPRTSFDGAGWNSRESFLPSPPETPATVNFSGQLFSDNNASQRLAHRMPTPYHPAKRSAFHAGWTGGSETPLGQEEDDFMTLPPSKRQSLGGYRSIQYRQATPGAAYVNANRLSVGSGMLSDTPDSGSNNSNLRNSSARSSISGYPSGLPQPSSYGSQLGNAAYTPMFRNNTVRFAPLTGPQYPASALASNAAQTPAVLAYASQGGASSETRVSRLPVSAARQSVGSSVTASASKNLPATLSYIQRRKLQMQSDSGASAAVAKKILDTLGGLSTPLEEQRQKPMAITWHGETNDRSSNAATAAPAQSSALVTFSSNTDSSKTVSGSSFSSASPKPAEEKDAHKSWAERIGAQAKSPFLHSSVRKQLDDDRSSSSSGKDRSDKPPSFGFAVPPKAAPASASAPAAEKEEFSFTEPTEVSGVEGAMEETVDRATGAIKRRVSAPIDTSVKYIFSPPNTTRKTESQSAVAASAGSAAKSTAATSTTKGVAADSSSTASSGINIWAASSINDGVKCDVCLAKNKKGSTKCASCENPIGPKPSTNTATAASASATTLGINIWAASSINDGVKCKTCLSKNKAGATKCASCECPIGDAATPAPAPAPTSSFGGAATTKAPGAIGDGGFTFGAPAPSASTAPAAAPSSSGKGFTFGGTTAAPASTAITFGTSAAAADKAIEANKPAFGGFAFSPPPAPVTTATTTPASTSAPATWAFGVPSKEPDANKPADAAPAAAAPVTVAFGVPPKSAGDNSTSAPAPAAAAAPIPAFGSFGAPATASAPSTAAVAPVATIGSFAPTPTASAPFGSFSAAPKRSADGDKEESDEQPSRKRKEEPSSSSGAGAGLTFGASSAPTFGAFPALPAATTAALEASTSASSSGFKGFTSFGSAPKPNGDAAPTAATSTLPALPVFAGFGPKPAEEKKTEAPATVSTAQQPFTFGTNAAPAKEAPPFVFGAGSTTAGDGKPVDQPFMFGGSAAPKTDAEEKKPFAFGGAKDSSAAPAPFTFGGAKDSSAPFTFGAVTADNKPATSTSAASSSSFTFGAGNAASTTAGKPPLASNSLGSSTPLSFAQAGVAAVDSRTNPSHGSTMDTGGFSNLSAPQAAAAAPSSTGNPFSSAFSGSTSNLAANSFPAAGAFGGANSGGNGAPFSFPTASAVAPSAGLGSTLGNTSSGGFGGFGSSNNLAAAAPSGFGAGAFGAPAAFNNNNAFGGPAPGAMSNPFSSQPPGGGAFGSTPASGLQPATSSSNLFGGGEAPAAGSGLPSMSAAPFGAAGGIGGGGFGGGAFGSTGSLQSLGGGLGGGGAMGGLGGMGGMGNNSMGSFGLQSQPSVDSGAGGFSLGAASKSADIAGRRKVKVKGRP